MNDNYWVKLYRKSLANEIRRHDPTAWRLFETLLLLADGSGKWSGGRYQLVEADGYLNGSTIYKALKRLEENEMISLSSNNRFTEIRICNFEKYKKGGNTSSNNEVTTNEQPGNTLNRIKNKELRIYSEKEMTSKQSQILQALNDATGRSFRTWPDEKRTRDTPKHFSPDDVTKAVGKMKLDDWHKQKLKQLSAGYLLAGSTLDKFLNYETTNESIVSYKNARPLDDRAAYKAEYGKKVWAN